MTTLVGALNMKVVNSFEQLLRSAEQRVGRDGSERSHWKLIILPLALRSPTRRRAISGELRVRPRWMKRPISAELARSLAGSVLSREKPIYALREIELSRIFIITSPRGIVFIFSFFLSFSQKNRMTRSSYFASAILRIKRKFFGGRSEFFRNFLSYF